MGRTFFASWVEQLKWGPLAPYQKSPRMLEHHIDGIRTYCGTRVSLGLLKGTNLKARNIARQAYRYWNKENMNLRIIQGCSSLEVFQPRA